jgi:formylglycine-generating enzyme required for sulfatase activity
MGDRRRDPRLRRLGEEVREPKSGIELILVEPGSFDMGSPPGEEGRNDDEVQHRVELTKAFYLDETEVTVGQWRRYADKSGYATEAEKSGGGFTVQSALEDLTRLAMG